MGLTNDSLLMIGTKVTVLGTIPGKVVGYGFVQTSDPLVIANLGPRYVPVASYTVYLVEYLDREDDKVRPVHPHNLKPLDNANSFHPDNRTE